jgi:hypothetical protein
MVGIMTAIGGLVFVLAEIKKARSARSQARE